MLDQLSYKDRNTFLQNVHTAAVLTYLAALLLLPLILAHPLYLLGVLLAGILAIVVSDAVEECLPFFVMGIWVAVFVMIVNPLVAQSGSTVLFNGPELPVLGRLRITLEAICYGATMGVRLMAIILTFALYNAVVHPDKVTGLFSRFAWKSSLLVSLATRMIPTTARDLYGAREVQQMRGVDFSSGSLRERIKKYSWLVEVLLYTSLEGSLETAEAMQARGFGTGCRSSYYRELVRPRDYLCLFSSLAAFAVAIYARWKGYADFTFYPRLDSFIIGSDLIWLGVIMLCLVFPLILSWGWKHWPYLRSKI
ncbi:MAG: energy-coupling factor transporter transmembrane component T [Syntrophaceticus sp.]|jgi:energy-coupling factor transport system permease protein|nr:energy-coupling factor transporter transmembrane component T [Syntrophaceticus sp.]MDD3314233.1 energy-coupling factor transporter transmembrane component T [Syntrophaceticus sp.]MDD4360015.1 energy-coupling factor transporter transmembrane component T [Syntrophaceticus sp.]